MFLSGRGWPVGELLADKRSQVVLNLTTPESHYEVTRAALEAGKHVQVEIPLACIKEKKRPAKRPGKRKPKQP